MKDYRSTEEKLEFTPRMKKVYEQVLARVKPYGYREGTNTFPLPDYKNELNPFVDEFEEHPERPYVINHANSIVRSWLVSPVHIFKDESVVGITRPIYDVKEHFSWGIEAGGNLNKSHELDTPTTPEKEKHFEELRKRMEPMNWSHVHDEGVRLMGDEKYWAMREDNMFHAGGFQGHTVPNYPRILEYGLDGMLEYIDECAEKNAKDEKTVNFYEANRIIVRGMSSWLELYAKKAEELAMSEADAEQKQYYINIVENCMYVAHKKPVTMYHAAQLMWTLALWDWVDCVGRMDQYFLPFYNYSKEHGDVVPAEDSIVSVVFKIWENGSHNVTLAGQTPTGENGTNELTYLLLQTLRNIHDTHPRMSVRFYDETPKDVMSLIVQMWSEGMSDPTVVSDKTVIPGLLGVEIPMNDARDYSMLGCQEIEIPGQSNTGCEDGVFNLAKVFEYTLNNGRSTKKPEIRVGLETGEFTDFKTFEEFYDAYTKQLEYFTEIFLNLCNKGQEIREANFAKLVKTPFTKGCLEKGLPHDMKGPIYNYGCIETAGNSVVADCMTAIKKLVFDEKIISAQTLMDAINANFEGYEKERQILLNKAPKFGNDDEEADAMAVRVLDQFWSLIGKYRSVRGGIFSGACSLLQGGISYGATMKALPDGRFAGEPIGNSIGPRPGADKNGVTAMLSSVSKLPLSKGVGGTTLNVVLTTKILSNPELRESTAATMRAYLMNGGQMAQITTANLDDLIDAQAHPERHGDLIVRIGGFSIQFVQLDKASQNEIISRYNGMTA